MRRDRLLPKFKIVVATVMMIVLGAITTSQLIVRKSLDPRAVDMAEQVPSLLNVFDCLRTRLMRYFHQIRRSGHTAPARKVSHPKSARTVPRSTTRYSSTVSSPT